MFKNYFKIAWRNITRHKAYTAINILGLALGICACIVIYLITSYEFSFDTFHPDKERIYRITGEMQNNSGEKIFLNSVIPDVAAFQHSVSGFEAEAGFHLYDMNVGITDGKQPVKKFDSRGEIIISEPQYFDIFKYDWLAGNAATVLNEPYKVVLSESKAHKYFGNEPLDKIIGKTVTYNDSLEVTVSGVVKAWNKHTDFPYTDFISISTAPNSFLKTDIPTADWSSLRPHSSMAFVKLNKGTTAAQVNTQFEAYIKTHIKPPPGAKLTMQLQPLKNIHFTDEYYRGDDGDNFRKAHLPTLYILMGIALFILTIASVNFINLSTACNL